jgi:iron complex outermembrane receptor protein
MSGKRRFLNSVSIAAVAAGIAAASTPAHAVETVTVTAERRSVDLQKTTISATVLNGDDLINKSVTGLTSLQYAAPGIQISDYGSANVFNMRGLGREAVDVEIPSGVAIYRDGVPTLAGYFQNEPYYDLAGVEVLRGPQGMVTGQSASGGALFIRSKTPDLNGLSGYVQAGVGDWDSLEVQGAVNLPLSDDAAVRLSVYHDQRGSWYNLSGAYTGHPATRNLFNGRFGVYWKPTEALEITFKTDVGRDDFGGNPVSTAGAPLFTIQLDDPMQYVDKSIRQTAEIRYRFGDGTSLRSLTGFQNVSTVNNLDANGGGPTPPLPPGLQTPINSFRSQGNFYFYSQEFDLVSPDDQRFRWVAGVFAERQVSRIPDWIATGQEGFTFRGFFLGFGTTFPVLTTPWVSHENDLAAFVNTDFDITPELTLEAGLRASYNQRHSFTDVLFGFGFAPPFIPLELPGDIGHVGKTVGDYLDGKVALQWKPNDDDFLYVQGSRGHTVKGVNIFPNAGVHDNYNAMDVWDYEAGWKSTIFDGHMRTQLDAYYESIGDYQAVFGSTVVPATFAIETRNAETRSKIWGIEASAQGNWDDFSIDFGAAYLNSKIGQFTNIVNPFASGVAQAEAIQFGDAACQTGSPTVTLTGAKAPFSPEVTGNIGAQYKIHTGIGGWAITPRADVSYTGTMQADLFACSLETIKSRTLVNLQARLDSDDSPWYASLWMTNVGDVKYVAAVQNIPPIYYAGPRRQFGIRFGRTF